jgi:toxin CcdB
VVANQFEVFRNEQRQDAFPFVVVVQHPLLAQLKTRVVVPCMPRRKFGGPPIPRLNPVFTVERTEVVLVTHLLGAVPLSSLRVLVTDLSSHRAIILGALDAMMTGV